MKKCIDCKWSDDYLAKQRKDYYQLACVAPQNRIDAYSAKGTMCVSRSNRLSELISGTFVYTYRYPYCHSHREDGWLFARIGKTCGKEGRWFEKKEDNQTND